MASPVRTATAIAGIALVGALMWLWLWDGTPQETIPMDSHSYARPNEVRVKHVDLDLELDFEKHEVRGQARLQLQRIDPQKDLFLDTKDLEILGVKGADGGKRDHRWGDEDKILGRALVISLQDGDVAVTIHYRTSPGAGALPLNETAQVNFSV